MSKSSTDSSRNDHLRLERGWRLETLVGILAESFTVSSKDSWKKAAKTTGVTHA